MADIEKVLYLLTDIAKQQKSMSTLWCSLWQLAAYAGQYRKPESHHHPVGSRNGPPASMSHRISAHLPSQLTTSLPSPPPQTAANDTFCRYDIPAADMTLPWKLTSAAGCGHGSASGLAQRVPPAFSATSERLCGGWRGRMTGRACHERLTWATTAAAPGRRKTPGRWWPGGGRGWHGVEPTPCLHAWMQYVSTTVYSQLLLHFTASLPRSADSKDVVFGDCRSPCGNKSTDVCN